MSRLLKGTLLAIAALGAGCNSGGSSHDDGDYSDRGPIYPSDPGPSNPGSGGGGWEPGRPGDHHDDRPPVTGSGWHDLGTQSIGREREYDRFKISGDRRYRQIKFSVEGGRIDLDSMNIVFKDGPDYSPSLEQIFEKGDESPTINLPGDKRKIDYIEFRYKRLSKNEARLTVWGK